MLYILTLYSCIPNVFCSCGFRRIALSLIIIIIDMQCQLLPFFKHVVVIPYILFQLNNIEKIWVFSYSKEQHFFKWFWFLSPIWIILMSLKSFVGLYKRYAREIVKRIWCNFSFYHQILAIVNQIRFLRNIYLILFMYCLK